jgi:hypothetical protein
VNQLIILLLLAAAAGGQTTPKTFEELSSQAQQAYEANRSEEAAQLFTQAVQLRPDWLVGAWDDQLRK